MTARIAAAASFDTFYRAERPRLLRYVRWRVGSDAAPDLVQEAFARLLRSGAFGRVEHPEAYLTRIAQNLLIDGARRKKGEPVICCLFDEELWASSRPEQAWRIEAIELLRLYRKAVRAMPPKTRRVFVMRRVKRMSCKEIAAALGIGVATVDYHMVQELALCRAAVAE